MTQTALRIDLTVNGVTLSVTQLSGTEGISELFAFEALVVSEDKNLDYGALIGDDAVLTLEHGATQRTIHGIVAEMTHARATSDAAVFHLRLVPRAWLLTLRTDCRIFQGVASLAEVVSKVLGDVRHRFALSKPYNARELYVQYRESDWAFLSRILEEQGVATFFEHDDEGSTLVVTDAPAAAGPALGAIEHAVDTGVLSGEGEKVTAFQLARRMAPKLVTARRVAYAQPGAYADYQAGVTGSNLEVYDYQPRQSAASQLAALDAASAAGSGDASSIRIASGARFALWNHPRGDLDREYLVTRVVHSAPEVPGKGYHCTFECIASSLSYSPPLRTPRPIVNGPQAATVIGETGEIDVDEAGRVLVRLHWDRVGADDGDANAVRVPVTQAFAGAGYGAMFVPRAGSHVLVEFLDGDPEKPVITGRAFNTLSPYPHPLPANKTVSAIRTRTSPPASDRHYHELLFEDRRGQEEVQLRAERRLRIHVENSDDSTAAKREVTVLGDDAERITGDQATTIAGKRVTVIGADGTAEAEATRTTIVEGDDALRVSGGRTVTIGVDAKGAEPANHLLHVYGSQRARIEGKERLRVVEARIADLGDGPQPIDDPDTTSYASSTTVRGDDLLAVGGSRRVVINGNEVHNVDGTLAQNVDGYVYQTYGGLETTVVTGGMSVRSAGGDLRLESIAGATKIGGNSVFVAAESNIEIRSATSISLVIGSLTDQGSWCRKITLDKDGVYLSNGDVTENLTGSHIKLNC